MKTFDIITMGQCVYCDKAKELITRKGDEFQAIELSTKVQYDLYKALGYKTVPNIVLDGVRIGGYDDLVKFYEENEI